MVTEKVEAFQYTGKIIIGGGSASNVIDNYQWIVAANVTRLSGRQVY